MKVKHYKKQDSKNYKKEETQKNIKLLTHQNTNIIDKKIINEQKKIYNGDINTKNVLRKSDNNLCLFQNINFTNYTNKITKNKIKLENPIKNSKNIKTTLTMKKTVKKALSPEKDLSSYYTVTSKKYNNNLNNTKVDNEILYMPQYTKINFEEKNNKKTPEPEYKTERKIHTNKILSSNNIRKSIKRDRIINISDSEDNSVIINNEEENEDNQVISTSFPKLSSNPFFTLNNEKKKANKNNENKKTLFFSPNLIRKKGRCIQQSHLYYNNKNINNNNNNKNSPSITKTVLSINSSTTQNSNDTINNINVYNLDNNKRKKLNDLNSYNMNINIEGEIDNEKIINNQNNNGDENNIIFKNLLNSIKNEKKGKIIEILRKIKDMPKNAYNLNIQDKENGNTALHYACLKNNNKIIQYLLEFNSDPNIKNNDRQTPLHIAAKEGYIEICKILIDKGALLNIYDSNKKTPIHYACENNYSELIKYFYDIFIEMDTDEKICDNLKNNKEINLLFKNYFQKEEKKGKNKNLLNNHFSSKTNILKNNNESLYYLINNKKNKSSDKIIKTKAKKSKLINIKNKNENLIKNNNNNTDTGSNISLNTRNSGINVTEAKLMTSYEKYNNNKSKKILTKGNNLIKDGYRKYKKTLNNPFIGAKKDDSLSKNKENDYYELNKTYDENSKFNGIKKNNQKNNNSKIPKNKYANTIKRKGSNIKTAYDSSQPKFNTSSKNIKFNLKSLKKLEALTEHKNNYCNTINKNNDNKFANKKIIEKKNLNEYYDKTASKNNIIKKVGQLNQTVDSDINMDITSINALNKMSLSLNLIKEEEEKISTKNFICLALLGRGSFGEVYLVQKINTKKKYAMKILRKERIIGQNLSKYAIAERNVLSISNHPFIVKLNYAFQSLTKLFLILEYCPGGDLAKHLSIEKKFEENRAKFYLCEILLALEYLHKKNIIFRDLKPENVVLDEEGHCKLTDFGLSKEGIDNDKYTKSFCGSIAYLAPEVLKKQGHGKAVDWYLLGVLLYEMLTGVTPYYDRNRNVLFYNIEQGKLDIPNYVSDNAKSLLIGLLQRDPKKRLGGSIRDAEEIKEHKFFEDIDWQKIYQKQYIPPKAIKINHNMYIFNKPKHFADENNLEEIFGNNSLEGWTFINTNEM